MQVLLEIWSASIAPWNLPFTVLLVLVLGYWGFVILGVFDLDTSDVGLDADAGMDVHADIGAEADAGVDMHADGDIQGDIHGGGGGADGWLHSVLHFLHVGDMPVMVPLSILSLCLWTGGVTLNHYLNPQQAWGVALGLLAVNLGVSGVLTRYLGLPLRKLFSALNRDADAPAAIVGQICQVTTLEVNPDYGQATVETRGAPITLTVRTTGDEVLRRGDRALVIGYNKQRDFFQITQFKDLKLLED